MNLMNLMDYHHFPIYSIMVLFLGAFVVAACGTKASKNLKNPAGFRAWIALLATALSLFFLCCLVKPVMLGGEMVKSVSELDCCYADAPHRFEAGTPNVAGAVALGTAIDWFSRNYEYIFVHERAVYDYAVNRLSSLGFVEVLGDRSGEHVSCISFNVDGCHPHDVASVLADENICIRAGYLCAQPYLDAINKGPCCRMSIGAHTTMVDVDILCEGLEKAKRVLSVGD